MMKSELTRFGRGFAYAWHGICKAVLEERNFRFHLCAAIYVYAAAALAGVSRTDVALISLCVFTVLGMELMNSAVERAVHKPDTGHWWSAGAAKDMAAGAVLATALGAVCVGVCVFGRTETLCALWRAVTASLWGGLLLLASLVPAYLFVFRFGRFYKQIKKDGTKHAEKTTRQQP